MPYMLMVCQDESTVGDAEQMRTDPESFALFEEMNRRGLLRGGARLGIVDRRAALRLGLLVWVFPATIPLGSVVHEGVPPALAAIHAGDWLTKLLLISVILESWRQAASAGGADDGHAPGRSRSFPVEVVGRCRVAQKN
jgi:hypothetical protein